MASIAVMKRGIEQLGARSILRPAANLFVAQSRLAAMNVFDGTLKNGSVEALGGAAPAAESWKRRPSVKYASGRAPQLAAMACRPKWSVEPMGHETELARQDQRHRSIV